MEAYSEFLPSGVSGNSGDFTAACALRLPPDNQTPSRITSATYNPIGVPMLATRGWPKGLEGGRLAQRIKSSHHILGEREEVGANRSERGTPPVHSCRTPVRPEEAG